MTDDPGTSGPRGSAFASPGYGATSITTTEIYLHVAVGENGLGVTSPLDGFEGDVEAVAG